MRPETKRRWAEADAGRGLASREGRTPARRPRIRVWLPILLLALSAPAAAQWVVHGPGPTTGGQVEGIADGEVVGAVHAVAPHPADADILYVGGANGGIWRTGNATAASPNWVPQTDFDASLSIGALEFDPTDATHQTLVAGIGRFSAFGRRGGARTGLLRTTDGGANWIPVDGGGDLVGKNISGVAARGATLVVSVDIADVFAFGNIGIFRSTDGGASFDQISVGDGSLTGLPGGVTHDLAADPTDPARLFTSVVYGDWAGGSNGVFRSDDTGATWTKVSDAAMDALISSADTGNTQIAVGTVDNVYVAIVNNGVLAGVFRSGDGGDNWTEMDLPETVEDGDLCGIHPGRQGGLHLSIVADPGDANLVYVGGDRQCAPLPNSIGATGWTGRLFRGDASQPAGSQWVHLTHSDSLGPAGGGTSSGSSPHADSREMVFAVNGDLIEGDDGGVYRRTSPRDNSGDWFSMNGDMQTTELHNAAWDVLTALILGGAQDTGTPQQVLPADVRWSSVALGDGGDVLIDDTSTPGLSIRYSSYNGLKRFRRLVYDADNVLQSWSYPDLTVLNGGAALEGQFTTPIELNAVDANRLIIGGRNSVYESLDQGDTITEIGPGIRVNAGGRDPIGYGAADNPEVLYVGAENQIFVRTVAGGALVASAAYPGAGWVADIAVDPDDSLTAFVVESDDPTTFDDVEPPRVYRTTDGGVLWADITGNLPDLEPGILRSIAYTTATAATAVAVGADRGVFRAPGPDFSNWDELGIELPEVPVFDLEYDSADQVLLAGTLGRGAWTWNLAERDPVDVMLVLDISGSMQSAACPGCDPKLAVLKDAVEIFVQLWKVLAVPADRLGVDYFRTDVSDFEVGGEVLLPVLDHAPAMIGDVQAQMTDWSQMTAMGGGLQRAINLLDDPGRLRSIILFTDGMQNVNPMVDDDASPMVIADDPTVGTHSNVDPTPVPTALDMALGRKINTIAVGASDPWAALLASIAFETGGLSKTTSAPEADLRRFYVEELVDALRGLSPQLIAYRRDELAGTAGVETFSVDRSARKIVLKLSWRRGQQLGFRVEKDELDLTEAGTIIPAQGSQGNFYQIYSLALPAQVGGETVGAEGDWVMKISGTAGASYEAAAIVDEPLLGYEFSVGDAPHRVAQPLALEVRLSLDGDPLPGAEVSAQVLAPGTGLGTLLSTTRTPSFADLDAEKTASGGQKKLQLLLLDEKFWRAAQPAPTAVTLEDNGNGTYSAVFAGTEVPGSYTVVFVVTGTHPETGSYRRTESVAAMVEFAAADLDRSRVRRHWPLRPSDDNPITLGLRPRDVRGNYLGPDYAHRIQVAVSPGFASGPFDRLDGGYEVQLSGVTPNSTVEISVMDRPLYQGTLSELQYRYAWSYHLGWTDPRGTLGRLYTGDSLAELDFEYALTRRFSLNAVLGWYSFNPGYEVLGGTVYARGYLPRPGFRFFGEVGAGLYDPDALDLTLGLSAGVGVDRHLWGHWRGEVGLHLFRLFTSGDDLEFLTYKAGVRRTF